MSEKPAMAAYIHLGTCPHIFLNGWDFNIEAGTGTAVITHGLFDKYFLSFKGSTVPNP